MNKQTRESLQDLAATLELLAQCEARVLRIPKRFRDLYLFIPPKFTVGIHAARCGAEELARELVEFQNLPPACADLSQFKKSNSR